MVGVKKNLTTVYDENNNKITFNINDREYIEVGKKDGRYRAINKGISINKGSSNPNYGSFKDRGLMFIKNKVLKI